MKTIVVANNKGGVGKTTTVQNMGGGLAVLGYRVLLIDLDPQSNLTACFMPLTKVGKSIYDSFTNKEPLSINKINENISLVPSSREMGSVDRIIIDRPRREDILNKLLKPIENDFDYCIIDTPPSLGIVTLNALVAGNTVIIPMEAEYFAYEGIKNLKDLIDEVKEEINPNLTIGGVFFTNMKPKLKLAKAMSKLVEQKFGTEICKCVIRENVSLAECQPNRKDIFNYDPESNGAKDYKALLNEVLKRIN